MLPLLKIHASWNAMSLTTTPMLEPQISQCGHSCLYDTKEVATSRDGATEYSCMCINLYTEYEVCNRLPMRSILGQLNSDYPQNLQVCLQHTVLILSSVCGADNLATFMCQLSGNLAASTSLTFRRLTSTIVDVPHR